MIGRKHLSWFLLIMMILLTVKTDINAKCSPVISVGNYNKLKSMIENNIYVPVKEMMNRILEEKLTYLETMDSVYMSRIENAIASFLPQTGSISQLYGMINNNAQNILNNFNDIYSLAGQLQGNYPASDLLYFDNNISFIQSAQNELLQSINMPDVSSMQQQIVYNNFLNNLADQMKNSYIVDEMGNTVRRWSDDEIKSVVSAYEYNLNALFPQSELSNYLDLYRKFVYNTSYYPYGDIYDFAVRTNYQITLPYSDLYYKMQAQKNSRVSEIKGYIDRFSSMTSDDIKNLLNSYFADALYEASASIQDQRDASLIYQIASTSAVNAVNIVMDNYFGTAVSSVMSKLLNYTSQSLDQIFNVSMYRKLIKDMVNNVFNKIFYNGMAEEIPMITWTDVANVHLSYLAITNPAQDTTALNLLNSALNNGFYSLDKSQQVYLLSHITKANELYKYSNATDTNSKQKTSELKGDVTRLHLAYAAIDYANAIDNMIKIYDNGNAFDNANDGQVWKDIATIKQWTMQCEQYNNAIKRQRR